MLQETFTKIVSTKNQNKMKNILIILLLAILASCHRSSDDSTVSELDKLPAATQSGANTAGCYINGKLLIPKNGSQAIGGSPAYGLNISTTYGSFSLNIKNFKENIFLHLFINNLDINKSKYFLKQSDGESFEPHNSVESQAYLFFDNKVYLSSDDCGEIYISKNTYPIISGVFNATLYNKNNPTEKIQITDGRFDINVTTLNK
jgi:hypothetical protein